MDTADVLIKARKLLSDPRRWGKFRFRRRGTALGSDCYYCALGAIAAVTCGLDDKYDEPINSNDPAYVDAVVELARQIEPLAWPSTPSPSATVYHFNDRVDTTYEDVMVKFSNAINSALVRREQSLANEPASFAANESDDVDEWPIMGASGSTSEANL